MILKSKKNIKFGKLFENPFLKKRIYPKMFYYQNNKSFMSTIINVKINGIDLKCDQEDTILKAAKDNNIYIPTLCYHPRVPEGK